jgi:uncharacterized hydrophobic protein (TIGR00271 family)
VSAGGPKSERPKKKPPRLRLPVSSRSPSEIEDQRFTIREQIASYAQLNAGYLVMNVLATAVAAYGLLAGSTAVVIGAMVIAQLLGPINGIALSLVDGDLRLLRRALTTEFVGVVAVLFTGWLVAKVHFGLPATPEILSRTQPSLLDLMIALTGGAAGAYAAASPRISAGLVGVAIATALVPPLTSAAILFAWGDYSLAGGAFLLFLINLVAIQFATSVVLWTLGYHKLLSRPESVQNFLKRNAPSTLILLSLGVGMYAGFQGTIQQNRIRADIRKALERKLSEWPAAELTDLQVREERGRRLVVATVRTPFSFTPEQVAEMEAAIPTFNPKPNALMVRSVLIKIANSERYLHQPPPEDEPETPLPLDLPSPDEP